MDISVFRQRLQTLTFLPPKQAKRALAVAEKMPENDLDAFLAELTLSDREIAQSFEGLMDRMEVFAAEMRKAERTANRIMQETSEARERRGSLKKAEKHLSHFS
ncbi:MAG: hypothetical protein V1926_02315 [Candidatus Peregrinibacteria bacterium]